MDGSTGEYVCLSYCWGSVKPMQLTSKNLAALTRSISLVSLPRSIQDAILVVRKIGFRYPWVDSLCIIQDSFQDKLKEIMRMDQIYSNANLTISAANADDCSRGFLAMRERWWSDADGPPIRLPFLRSDGVMGSVSLVRYGPPTYQEPLHCRAWPFQEHLLSPRVLLYGSEQMFWICNYRSTLWERSSIWKDGGQRHVPSIKTLQYLRELLNSSPYAISPLSGWKTLVEEYSLTKQSMPDDRIHAIRGIAHRFQALTDDQYIAGLWKSWLLYSLTWERSGPIYPRPGRHYPSWSWLSIDSAVTMERDTGYHRKKTTSWLVDLIDCSSDSRGEVADPFGLLPYAIVRLRGHITKVENPNWKDLRLRLRDTDPTHDQTRFLSPRTAYMALDATEVTSAVSSHANQEGPVWCLPMLRVWVTDHRRHDEQPGTGWALQGLLLSKDSGSNIFRRIGWFSSSANDDTGLLATTMQEVVIR
ncbi:MAG: hypothetical protein Q9213_002871 [Squamulea squamosa]